MSEVSLPKVTVSKVVSSKDATRKATSCEAIFLEDDLAQGQPHSKQTLLEASEGTLSVAASSRVT